MSMCRSSTSSGFTERIDEMKPCEHEPAAAPIEQTIPQPNVGVTVYDVAPDSIGNWPEVPSQPVRR